MILELGFHNNPPLYQRGVRGDVSLLMQRLNYPGILQHLKSPLVPLSPPLSKGEAMRAGTGQREGGVILELWL